MSSRKPIGSSTLAQKAGMREGGSLRKELRQISRGRVHIPAGSCGGLCALEQLDLVAVRVGDKRHLHAARLGEFLPPAIRPNRDTFLFQLVAFRDEIGVADGG